MNKENAIALLTPETITTTMQALLALDMLQGFDYVNKIEGDLPPHAESDVINIGEKALKLYLSVSFAANGNGMAMNSSAFISILNMLELHEQAELAKQQLNA